MTPPFRCLVVDDEPIARRVLAGYIEQMPSLTLAAECMHAIHAIEYLRANPAVDLLFLDINMPHLSGLQLLKIAQPKQPVIFTTAYAEHAVESYELNAVDYLLKPFSFERFMKAVYKAIDVLSGPGKPAAPEGGNTKILYVKSDGKNYPIRPDEVLYCEAKKNYTLVVLQDGRKLLPLIPLSKFETHLQLAGGAFLQVHRSFLVNRAHVGAVSASAVFVGGHELPIGVQFRERFFGAMGIGS